MSYKLKKILSEYEDFPKIRGRTEQQKPHYVAYNKPF